MSRCGLLVFVGGMLCWSCCVELVCAVVAGGCVDSACVLVLALLLFAWCLSMT